MTKPKPSQGIHIEGLECDNEPDPNGEFVITRLPPPTAAENATAHQKQVAGAHAYASASNRCERTETGCENGAIVWVIQADENDFYRVFGECDSCGMPANPERFGKALIKQLLLYSGEMDSTDEEPDCSGEDFAHGGVHTDAEDAAHNGPLNACNAPDPEGNGEDSTCDAPIDWRRDKVSGQIVGKCSECVATPSVDAHDSRIVLFLIGEGVQPPENLIEFGTE